MTTEDGDYYEFPVNKWFDKHQDDGKISRELLPRKTKKSTVNTKKSEVEESADKRQPLGNNTLLCNDRTTRCLFAINV